MSRTRLQNVLPDLEQEGKTLAVDTQTGNVEYTTTESAGLRKTAQIGFNPKDGTLNFIRYDGEVIVISGFLTSAQLGQGKQGKRGNPGKPGKNGKEGRLGKKGNTGCEGPIGATGPAGEAGEDGEDGESGIKGYAGCPGPPGPPGAQGPKGRTGNTGARGATGISCLPGPRGEVGPSPRESVWYSNNEPPADYFIWAIPSDGYVPGVVEDPDPVVEEMQANVNPQTGELEHLTGYAYSGSLLFSITGLTGGQPPYSYTWRDMNAEFSDPAITVGNTGTDKANLRIDFLVQIEPGEDIAILGEVGLTIRDSVGESLVVNNVPFTMTGTNDGGDDSDDGGGPVVGGGGCVDADSLVEVKDRGVLKMRNVQIGDYVRSYSIPGMLDESDPDWQKWTTQDSSGTEVWSQVRSKLLDPFTSYWQVNDLRITSDHYVFVRRDNTWRWMLSQDIKIGDYLWAQDQPQIVTTLEFVQKPLEVVILDVEPQDCYFVGGVLVHNQTSTVKK